MCVICYALQKHFITNKIRNHLVKNCDMVFKAILKTKL